ncbi:MAG: hypothetical protein VW873_08985, partial [Betaproteobacteria bacterium]
PNSQDRFRAKFDSLLVRGRLAQEVQRHPKEQGKQHLGRPVLRSEKGRDEANKEAEKRSGGKFSQSSEDHLGLRLAQ